MLKKEFKDILKLAFILLGMMIIALIILFSGSLMEGVSFDLPGYLLIFYQLWILSFSFFLGISLFSSEIRNNGFEYLLTLPFSRTKLLMIKVSVRLIVLAALYLVYLFILSIHPADPFILPPAAFNALYLSVFFISTSLSVLRGNFVANSLITFLLMVLFLFAANFISWLVVASDFHKTAAFRTSWLVTGDIYPFGSGSIFLVSLFLSLPFILSLFYGFRKYDIRSSGRYLKRFFTLLVPLLGAGMLLSFLLLHLNISGRYDYYYLTSDGMVFRDTMNKTFVLTGEGEKEIGMVHPMWWSSYERDGWIYVSHYDRIRNGRRKISGLNKRTLELKDLYFQGENGRLSGIVYGNDDTICFMETSGGMRQGRGGKGEIIFMDLKSGKVKRSAFPYPNPQLFGVVQNGDHGLWLGFFRDRGGEINVFGIDIEGRIEPLIRSDGYPVFLNNRLITFDKGNLVAGMVTDTGYTELKKFPVHGYSFYPNRLDRTDLNPLKTDCIYGTKREGNRIRGFVMVDLVNLEMKAFSVDSVRYGGIWLTLYGGSILTKYEDEGQSVLNSVFRFDRDRLVLLKDFLKTNNSGITEFYHTKHGFILREGKNPRFYLYPDLKEINPRFRGTEANLFHRP